MQGEHLNIVCQMKSVYYSLGKQTSEEKKKEKKKVWNSLFLFSPALLISFSSKGLAGHGFPLALEGACPVAFARCYISGMLVSCLVLEAFWCLEKSRSSEETRMNPAGYSHLSRWVTTGTGSCTGALAARGCESKRFPAAVSWAFPRKPEGRSFLLRLFLSCSLPNSLQATQVCYHTFKSHC